jgi:glycosyltransferase involved in cell wall biosynthesis
MSAVQISIVIPTLKGAEQLATTIQAILQQQSAPAFEILVVSNLPNYALERSFQAWDKRLKYFCSGEIGVNSARNLGLQNAQGDIVLFLDDDIWIDDKLFLKKHLDAHQRFPEVIGVGGPCTLMRNANLFETAYHWILNTNFERARVDVDHATSLPGGNSSFKTLALKAAYRFNAEIDFGGAADELFYRLSASGQKLHFTDRIVLEHRVRMGLFGFLRRAYLQGRTVKVQELQWQAKSWRFVGSNHSRQRQIAEHSGTFSSGLNFAFALYDLTFAAGKANTTHAKYQRHLTMFEIIKNTSREIFARIKAAPRSAGFMEVFISLRFSIFGK